MNLSKPMSDIILYNGTIATQDDRRPLAQAVALGQGRIIAVGDNQELLSLAGPETEKIDLDGRLLVPGFIDTHIHFYEWALKRQGIRLDNIVRIEDLLSRVRHTAAERPSGQWIIGQGWNETDWTEPRMPTREVLDKVAPEHPVLLWRCDLHLAVANTVALEKAGINANTSDPPEGLIERDDRGEPNGILRELAINLVRCIVTPPDTTKVMEAFEDATMALHGYGVTGIQDIRLMEDKDGANALQTFQTLDRENRLALRSWVTLPGERLDEIIGLGLRSGFGNDRMCIGHVKFFSDGGMGARTAWMVDPYLDAGHGMPLMDMTVLASAIRKADAAGLSVMVHAVGDRANRELIGIFEKLYNEKPQKDTAKPYFPHRIEHVQMIRPEDVDRLGKLKVAIGVTPANMVLDINLIDTAVGEKGKWAYAFRSLIDTTVPVMFSSDCPVCEPDPLVGIHAAVTRQRADGTPAKGWYPKNQVTVIEALKAYTVIPALVHRRPDLGMIAPGGRADLAVISHNILDLPPSRLPETHVDMTLFDGRIVHRLF